jgi:hypothetical protein
MAIHILDNINSMLVTFLNLIYASIQMSDMFQNSLSAYDLTTACIKFYSKILKRHLKASS